MYTSVTPPVDGFEPVLRQNEADDSSCNVSNTYRTILPMIFLSFLLAMAFGSTLGIVPSIMTERFARLKYGNSNCDGTNVSYGQKAVECIKGSKDAQTAASVSELVSNFLTLVTSSWIGSISDIHGRRPLLILGVTLSSMGPFSLLLTVLYPNASGVFYYCCKTMNGLVHWMVITLSAVADVLPKRQRAAGIGLLMAGFWLGLCIAPILAVFLSQRKVVALSCMLQCSGLVCAFLVPETLPPEIALAAREKCSNNQEHATKKHKGPFVLLPLIMRPMQGLSIINRNSFLRLLSALAFFSGMATNGDQTLLLYYVDSVLSFDPTDVAIMFLLVGGSTVFAQAVMLRPLNICIGERWIIIICFVAATCSNVMYGLASSRHALYVAVCVGALSGMAFPTISAVKANNVAQSEQGRIQGALFSIQAIAGAIGPSSMRAIDSMAVRGNLSPGSMFFFAAFLQFGALCCACRLSPVEANSRPATTG
jgi:DHA1 family tetracycline resistance protein-like MFS transporter